MKLLVWLYLISPQITINSPMTITNLYIRRPQVAITTEAGEPIQTEAGQNLVTE